jgi:hypothetical protein
MGLARAHRQTAHRPRSDARRGSSPDRRVLGPDGDHKPDALCHDELLAESGWQLASDGDPGYGPHSGVHSHVLFWFPAGITMAIGTYLYGRYRLPKVYGPDKGFPWSFGFLIAASVTEPTRRACPACSSEGRQGDL